MVTILGTNSSSFSRHLCSCSYSTPRAPPVQSRLLTGLIGQALPVSSALASHHHTLLLIHSNYTVIGPGSPASGRPTSIPDSFFPTPRAITAPGEQSAHLFTVSDTRETTPKESLLGTACGPTQDTQRLLIKLTGCTNIKYGHPFHKN